MFVCSSVTPVHISHRRFCAPVTFEIMEYTAYGYAQDGEDASKKQTISPASPDVAMGYESEIPESFGAQSERTSSGAGCNWLASPKAHTTLAAPLPSLVSRYLSTYTNEDTPNIQNQTHYISKYQDDPEDEREPSRTAGVYRTEAPAYS